MLCILPERYYKGENFVIEHNEKEGAVFGAEHALSSRGTQALSLRRIQA